VAEIALSVEVDAAPEVVFAALTDWERQSEWMAGTTVRVTAGDGHSRGSRLLARTAAGPVGFDDPMEITGWEPSRRVQVHHLGRAIRGDGAFEVEPLPGGRSRFSWTEWIDLPLGRLGQLGFPLARPLVVAGLRPSLRAFARFAERRG
jgi:hypothetical protein